MFGTHVLTLSLGLGFAAHCLGAGGSCGGVTTGGWQAGLGPRTAFPAPLLGLLVTYALPTPRARHSLRSYEDRANGTYAAPTLQALPAMRPATAATAPRERW